jgi:hypothetical protein
METGKVLFKFDLGRRPDCAHTPKLFNGYLLLLRNGQTEIWRRACDTSFVDVYPRQQKQATEIQGHYDTMGGNDPGPRRQSLSIKNETPRGAFVPCGAITTPQTATWYGFSFPFLYIRYSSSGGRLAHVLVYDVRTLKPVRSIENLIPSKPCFINKEHALLPEHGGFACVVDSATFRNELLFIGKDPWWTRVGPGRWRRTITDNIFTIWPLEVSDDVVKVKLRRGMSLDKPAFPWNRWEKYMFSPDGCDIVRARARSLVITFMTVPSNRCWLLVMVVSYGFLTIDALFGVNANFGTSSGLSIYPILWPGNLRHLTESESSWSGQIENVRC